MAATAPSRPDGGTATRLARRRILTIGVVVVLLGQLALLLCLSSSQESPVSDEATYIGAAAAYDKYGDLDMNIEHPPLAKLIAGLPLRITGIDAPKPNAYLTFHQRQYGWHVIYVANDAGYVVWLARIPEIVLTVAFGLVVFFFARDVWGGHAGLAALALYALMPSVLAQGGVATNDMLVAQATVLCLWLLWRARERPRLYLPLVAIALGLALATKATAFGVLPLVAGLTGYIGYRQLDGSRPRRWLAGVAVAAGVVAVAIGVVWCVYLAADPHLRVGSPHTLADQVHGIRRTLIDLLPLPRAYKVGLLIQMSLETEKYPVAILGHSFDNGTRLFLPAALLIKTPIPVLLLGAAGAVRAVRRLRRDVLAFVVLPALWLLVSTIALTKRPYGSRYILSVMVMLCVLGGAMVVRNATSAERRWRLQRSVAVALVAATAVGSYLTYPYYFTYSNAAFGGSTQTAHTFPNDADTDQDLRRVADYVHRHHITGPIYWLEHGGVPSAYGIHDIVAPQAPDVIQGLTVVFGSQLDLADRKRLAKLRPLAVIGNDVFVYDLPPRPGTVPPAVNARAGKRDVR